jgi:Uma2 family endonuclease
VNSEHLPRGGIVSAPAWPDHLLSFDEWEQLPEYERFKVEVVEGVLVVSPRPKVFHQRAISSLSGLLNDQLPRALEAIAEVELIVEKAPLTIRIPDIVVVPTVYADSNPPSVEVEAVRLAVEVLSDGSRRTDRVTKFAEYAEAGIRRYWLVDIAEPISLTAYVLVDGAYELDGEFTGTADLQVEGSPVHIALDALTAR